MTRLAGFLVVGLMTLGLCCSPQPPPNIIFIIADDLGYGDLGSYGQTRIQTPHVDRLAREGVRFTDFYAGSTVCAPSRSVLMTGQHVGHTLIRGNAKTNLRPEDITVAEVLKGAGYRTGLTGKWGLGHEGSTGMPTRQGFDYFYGYLDQQHAHNYYPSFLIQNEDCVALQNEVPNEGEYGQGVAARKVQYSHDLIIEKALEYVRNSASGPFFLYLALTIPHANNEAGPEGMEVPDLSVYADRDWPLAQKSLAAMISRMDSDIGRLLSLLKELEIDQETIIFFTSDNGPHAEGGNDPDFFDSNGPLRGIKRDLYEGGIRVPMIVRWPHRTAPGSVSNHVAYFGDVLATLADLVDVPVPGNTDGVSFLPSILGQEQSFQHEYVYWEFYERGSAQAIRSENWKAVRKPMFEGEIELYDLSTDLGESRNVATDHPDVVNRMRSYMEKAHIPSELWNVN